MAECEHEWHEDGPMAGTFTCGRCGADKLRWLECALAAAEERERGMREALTRIATIADGCEDARDGVQEASAVATEALNEDAMSTSSEAP